MSRFADFASANLEQVDTPENQMENLRRVRIPPLPPMLSGQINVF